MGLATNYDTVPYPDFVHPRTDPNSLAAMARVFGVPSPGPSDAKILELGCGQGGNLISIASMYPLAQCLGVDLSVTQIASGQSCIDQLGLQNIRLHAADISDFPTCLCDQDAEGKYQGPFDYIIAHGVYSWVSDPVRRHLLRIAREHLSPLGVAFFSYNTYPGWHVKGVVRELLRHHTDATESLSLEAISEAKRLLADVAESVPDSTGYGRLLREQSRAISNSNDAYLFHEQFEAVNEPRYFHQFVDEIETAGMRYVGESSLTFLPSLTDAMRQRLAAMGRVQREQSIDFLGNRSFRQSLICRSDSGAPNAEDPNPAALESMHLSTDATCTGIDGVVLDRHRGGSGVPPELRATNPNGTSVTITNPITGAVLMRLAEIKPASESFDKLWQRIRSAVSDELEWETQRATLREDLLQLAYVAMVHLHATQRPLVDEVSDRPMTSSLARRQAQQGAVVTSQQHVAVRLDPPLLHLITLCDGENDLTAIHAGMVRFVTRDCVALRHQGREVTDPKLRDELVREKLGPNLNHLAQLGFFIR